MRCNALTQRIPNGKVTSYAAISKCLGTARSARMVCWVMNNSLGIAVPADRFVNRIWVLTGKYHFDGTNLMWALLENEGHKFEGDQLLNFNHVFCIPTDV